MRNILERGSSTAADTSVRKEHSKTKPSLHPRNYSGGGFVSSERNRRRENLELKLVKEERTRGKDGGEGPGGRVRRGRGRRVGGGAGGRARGTG